MRQNVDQSANVAGRDRASEPDLSESGPEAPNPASPAPQARPVLALVGHPNCGKTTLFNALTGRHSRTANYPGATVDYSIGALRELWDWPADVVDLPGTSSLVPRSPDEEVALRSLYGPAPHPLPRIVIAVADATQLARHLYLTRQILSTGVPTVLAVTMSDLLARRSRRLDSANLEALLGCPVAVVDARAGVGVKELIARVQEKLGETGRPFDTGAERPDRGGLRPQPDREQETGNREQESGNLASSGSVPRPQFSVPGSLFPVLGPAILRAPQQLSEAPQSERGGAESCCSVAPAQRAIAATVSSSPLRRVEPTSPDAVKAAYAELETIERACLHRLGEAADPAGPHVVDSDPVSRQIDRVLLHPVFGLVGFALIMGGMFSAIFWAAAPAMDFIDEGSGRLAEGLLALAPGSFLMQLAADGIVRGAGAVLVFLPQIVILFLGMGLLEDTGYLARAAVLVDRPLAMVGLNGRSFVPLLSGFACAIPGMMAARTIPNRRERLLTVFVMPLMSCSARLPVYALLLAFLTPRDRPWVGGVALAALYLASLLAGAVTAGLVSRFLPAKGHSSFMLELPAYRRPQLSVVLRTTYERSKHYVKKAGVPIVVISMALWLLCNLPRVPTQGLPAGEAQATQLEGSYAAAAGKLLEPVMRPMGLDWRVGVALIGSYAAREVFVGSMAVIFHVAADDDEVEQSLLETMRSARLPDGSPLFTTASSLGIIVFFIFAMQCLSTAVVASKEAEGWWMPAAQTVAFTGFAYVAAVAAVQTLRAMGVA